MHMSRVMPDVLRVGRPALDVDRETEMCRAGSTGRHCAESRAHGIGNLVGMLDHLRGFRQRAHKAGLIELGQRIVSA